LLRADLLDSDSFFENKVESEIEQKPMSESRIAVVGRARRIAVCFCHRERSEANQRPASGEMDCFAAFAIDVTTSLRSRGSARSVQALRERAMNLLLRIDAR
jgi:hypothetical protein